MQIAKVIEYIEKITSEIDVPVRIASVSLFSLSVLLLCSNIVLRYIFLSSYEWIEELMLHTLLFAIFLYAAPVYKKGSHVSMEFLSQHYRGTTKVVFNIIFNFVVLATCVIFFWQATKIDFFLYENQVATLSGTFKSYILYLPFPIGMLVFIIYGLGELIKSVCFLFSPELINDATSDG